MMIDMSFVLVEPICYTTLLTPVSAPGATLVTVGSLGIPINALYDGAQLVVDGSTINQEIVTVTLVSPPTNQFTATFANTHAIGASVIGATFPTQVSSGDYFFSQAEIASYIARAQNNFLADVPCIFSFNTQSVAVGQIYQQLACDAIEIVRAASSAQNIALSSLVRAGNVVTATSVSPHGLVPNQKISVYNVPDPSFAGGFIVATTPTANIFTYPQVQPNATISSGTAGLWLRLYLTSQEELYIQNPFWRNQNITQLSSIFEDRTGNYQFGVNGKPSTTLPIEMLVSSRDTDTLALTDGFLVPDPLLHIVRLKALEFAFSKDGEMRSPQMEKYCNMRYQRGVMMTKRWMDGLGMGMGLGMASNGAAVSRG